MPVPVWRLLRSGAGSGPFNMALDQILLETVAAGRSQPVLRFYRWQVPTVSLGYAQREAGAVNLETCRKLGFQVVRRMTGGRAVLHDQEVTYAVVAPERGGPFPGEILANYRVIAGVLQASFADLGLVAELAEKPMPAGGGGLKGACFTAPITTELLYRGCKLAGGAQKRQGGAFLQHGSVPVEFDLRRLFQALNTDPGLSVRQGVAQLAERVGWVNRWRSPAIGIDDLEDRFIVHFAERLGVELVAGEPTSEELSAARDLALKRFPDLCRPRAELPVDSPECRHYV